MVEPLFRFDGQVKAGSVVVLDGPEGHHAAAVRRIRVGEAVQLTDGSKVHSRGIASSVGAKSLEIKISEVFKISPPKVEFVLVQALAKGDRDELAIQAATELGVSSVIPWQSERSISKWDDAKAAKNQARWQTICDEASKQALRPRFVDVKERQTSKQLAELIRSSNDSNQSATWFVLDPTADVSLVGAASSDAKIIYLVVGPEGGITEQELASFASVGAQRVHLGSGILRTSTAGVAALAFLSGAAGLWQ
jgi:16S rRNA (uracil1498-N3)-methyltransferase